jgi:formylmethanofuran dehydrogenase subunit B
MTAEATVDGSRVPLARAIAAAAALLGRAERPAIAGLHTDAAGIAAALRLARRLGAAIDHADSAACLRDIDAMRTGGWIVATPLQVRARADLLLLAGTDLPPGLDGPPTLVGGTRTVLRMAADAETVGALRARLAGRRTGALPASIAPLADALPKARYGAVIWDSATADALDIAMLCGLIDDLNAATRYVGLPLEPAGAACAMQVSAALTGLPLPLHFQHDLPRHDPDAAAAADAVLWIGAPPPGEVAVALLPPGATAHAAVCIGMGEPGRDHDTVLFDPALGALTARSATHPSAAPRCADLLRRLEAALC